MSLPVNCIILCGGSGTRLWPLSREKMPKQLLPLVGQDTMLQSTIKRLILLSKKDVNINSFQFICNKDHAFIVEQQIKNLKGSSKNFDITENYEIITEPQGRDTAPAIAIATQKLHFDHLSLVVPSDHIFDDDAFTTLVADKIQKYKESMVLFGIRPNFPATGYGYIESSGYNFDYQVESFREKPDYATASQYLSTGKHFWNAGVFLFKNSVMQNCFMKYAPDIYIQAGNTLAKSNTIGRTTHLCKEEFDKCQPISIDYAIMENICKDNTTEIPMFAYPYGSTWCDVGSFEALQEYLLNNGHVSKELAKINAVCYGNVMLENTRDCYVHTPMDKLVSVIGMEEIVIVDTPDALLVCNKNETQKIKNVVKKLKNDNRPEAQFHNKVFRPWGWYVNIDGNDHSGTKIKRLVVLPGMRLSLQSHEKREEHWVIVKGNARVQLGELQIELKENQYVHIPIGVTHRVENTGTDLLEIVETQVGEYLGEDDIIRYQDDFGRV